MTAIFVFCAVVGGTILVCQFVLTLVGFGHDVGGDLAHDLSADAGGDVHTDVAHDGAGDGQSHSPADHSSSWLFGVISFRTLVAAFAFFGLAGLAADSGGLHPAFQILIASASGVAAMYAVHYLMKQLGRLGEDSTVRIQRAIGREGTVYIPIPAQNASAGKVQLTLQNRLIEYEAVTSGEKLPTGTKVRVTGIRGSILEVEPILQQAVTA